MKSTDTEAQSYEPAPVGSRLAAQAIDCLIVVAILYAAFASLIDLLPDLIDQYRDQFQVGYLILCAMLLFTVYHTVSLWLVKQTLGKALLGIRVTRFGKKPGLFWALGRSSFGYFIVDMFGIGLIVALFNPARQTLHDYVFGSAVIKHESGSLNIRDWPARFTHSVEELRAAAKKKHNVIGTVFEYWEKLSGYWEKLAGYWAAFQSLVGAPVAAASATTAVSTAAIATAALTLPVEELVKTPLCPPNCPVVVAHQHPPLIAALSSPPSIATDPPPPAPPLPVPLRLPVKDDFVTDAGGWTVSGDARGPVLGVREISAEDKAEVGSNNTWYWEAPNKYLGEKGDAYGTQLRFQLKTSSSFADAWSGFNADDVVLRSGKLTLVYDIPHPDSEWERYCVPLDGSAEWLHQGTKKRATVEEMQTVLKDLKGLQIRGEYKRRPGDQSWLKAVEFGDPNKCDQVDRPPGEAGVKTK